MCRQCHSTFTDEQILAQLRESIDDPKYELWNTTSLSHMLICIEGHNGAEAHELGLKLANGFCDWYLGMTNGAWEYVTTYMPSNGIESFPHSTEIRAMIDAAVDTYENGVHTNAKSDDEGCECDEKDEGDDVNDSASRGELEKKVYKVKRSKIRAARST